MIGPMLTVTELARQSGTPAHVVRYYIRIGLIKPFMQQNNGYRLFKPGSARHVRFIRTTKQLGFTLCEIGQIMDHAARGATPCPEVRNIIKHRVIENREKIESMLRLQAHMEKTLLTWENIPDGVPDTHHVCDLIENFFNCEATNTGGSQQ